MTQWGRWLHRLVRRLVVPSPQMSLKDLVLCESAHWARSPLIQGMELNRGALSLK